MTQEVQPLAWQKRTNLEEHQQFFAKINEIIANLAPTVDEAEAAIAQATAAIASANDAIATANAASAAASAAASQAQTAASTVADYDGRLTAAEGDIDAIEGREPDYLKKAGAAQTVTSQIMVPTTTTGARDTQVTNGTRIQNDLDSYAAMVRTTGNQTKSGELNLVQMLGLRSTNIDEMNPPTGYSEYPNIQFNDMNGNRAALMFKAHNNELNVLRIGNVYTHNGSRKRTYLVSEVNEATGMITWFIEWGDGTVTELARKQLS